MRNFKKRLCLSLIIALGVSGLFILPVSADNHDAAEQERIGETVGDIRALTEEEGLGLAGIYLDDNDVLNIMLAGTAEEIAADTAAVKEIVPDDIEVAFHEARYEMATLQELQESLRPHYQNEELSLVGSGIDTTNNRVYLEILNLTPEKEAAILELIPADLPKEAIEFHDVDSRAVEEVAGEEEATEEKGGELADTATNNAAIMLIGGMLALAGIVLIVRRRQKA